MQKEAIAATYIDGLIEITGDSRLGWDRLTGDATRVERIASGLIGWGPFTDIYRIEHFGGARVGVYLVTGQGGGRNG